MEQAHFELLYPVETRFREIEKILQLIKEGKSVQLVGLAGVGRSNILGLLSYNKHIRSKHLGDNQKWFHFVPVNFSEIRNRPLEDAMKLIFLSLVNSLREREVNRNKESAFAGEGSHEAVNAIFNETISSKDDLVIFQGLKRAIDYLSLEKELTIVFLFDRFEEYIPMLSSGFFANIRILRNRAKYRFSTVFSLSRPLEELIEPEIFADFYEFLAGNMVYIPILDKPGLDFRISYLEKVSNKKIESGLLDKIISLTGGHGKLTRLSIETVFENQITNNQDLISILLKQKPIQASLIEIWRSLIPSEQKSLIKNEANIEFLERAYLISKGRISIPLFEEFIKSNSSLVTKSELSFDKETGDIKLGDISISSSLTSSEFKLLKFFLSNQDKIITREDVINSVWQDNKSKEGVTDQALDQLIFRLRKKIEEDPNKPTHIETLKGLGIKFKA